MYREFDNAILKVSYSELVYSNSDAAGSLADDDFELTDTDNYCAISSLSHIAGSSTADITLGLALDSTEDIGLVTLATVSLASIYDEAGNTMNLTTTTIFGDSTPPEVSGYNPAQGDTNVPINSDLTFTLSDGSNNFQDGYRLKCNYPAPYTSRSNTASYPLCTNNGGAGCHTSPEINDKKNDIDTVFIKHGRHLGWHASLGYKKALDSDFSRSTESSITCLTCHNVHGAEPTGSALSPLPDAAHRYPNGYPNMLRQDINPAVLSWEWTFQKSNERCYVNCHFMNSKKY